MVWSPERGGVFVCVCLCLWVCLGLVFRRGGERNEEGENWFVLYGGRRYAKVTVVGVVWLLCGCCGGQGDEIVDCRGGVGVKRR